MPAPDLASRSALVVESTVPGHLIATELGAIFREWGCEAVASAIDGVGAVKALESGSVDLVVFPLSMSPDGLAFARYLQSRDGGAAILLLEEGEAEAADEALGAGGDALARLPLEEADLAQAVRAALGMADAACPRSPWSKPPTASPPPETIDVEAALAKALAVGAASGAAASQQDILRRMSVTAMCGPYLSKTNGRFDLPGVPPGVANIENIVAAVVENQRLAEALRASNEQLRIAQEQLQKRDAERSRSLALSQEELEQFAYVATHDLNEPLTLAKGYIDLLAHDYSDALDPVAREYLSETVGSVERMRSVLKDLMEFINVRTTGNGFEPTNLNQVVEMALTQGCPCFDERRASISLDPMPTVSGDRKLLVRAFRHLISNAVKFVPDGMKPQVRIGVEKGQDDWTVAVRDNGIGVDPKYFGKIFLLFQKLHPHNAYPGNGAGLSICKKTIELHGGRIWIESRLGKGSALLFTLPRRPIAEIAA